MLKNCLSNMAPIVSDFSLFGIMGKILDYVLDKLFLKSVTTYAN